MTDSEVKVIFEEILESIPGVHSICKENNELCAFDHYGELNVQKIANKWDFIATIVILKNANAKEIVNSIGSLLRHRLKLKNQKLGKLNIVIGGLTDD